MRAGVTYVHDGHRAHIQHRFGVISKLLCMHFDQKITHIKRDTYCTLSKIRKFIRLIVKILKIHRYIATARGRFFTNKKANGLIESTICIYNDNNANNNNKNNNSNNNNNI